MYHRAARRPRKAERERQVAPPRTPSRAPPSLQIQAHAQNEFRGVSLLQRQPLGMVEGAVLARPLPRHRLRRRR